MGTNWIFLILGVLAMIFGLFIFWGSLKKTKKSLPSDEVEYKDGVPITPRDARDSVEAVVPTRTPTESATTPSDEPQTPSEGHVADALGGLAAAVKATEKSAQTPVSQTPTPQAPATEAIYAEPTHIINEQLAVSATADDQNTQEMTQGESVQVAPSSAPSMADFLSKDTSTKAQTDGTQSTSTQTAQSTSEDAKSEFRFDNRVEVEFDENSPVLDEHFHEIAEHDRNNEALLKHKRTLTVLISPKNSFDEITGLKVLELTKSYAMKYGIMNMFHRYEHNNGTGDLWFSMLGVVHDGVRAFDLNELPEARFRGLALFISLPHHNALKAFNSMVSVAQMIARELDADLHDEEGYLLTTTELQALQNTLDD